MAVGVLARRFLKEISNDFREIVSEDGSAIEQSIENVQPVPTKSLITPDYFDAESDSGSDSE